MDKPQTLSFTRRNLPHWLVAESAYFVTIRLKNTLPAAMVQQLREEREKEGDSVEMSRKQFMMIESLLDSSSENRLLDNPDVATLIIDSLAWLEKRGWIMYALTILSTHIHLLMRNRSGRSEELLNDIARFKNYTARVANKVLGRSGHFWAREDFDHWLRTPDRFDNTVRYIANNSVKAGRVNKWSEWPWTVIHEEVMHCLDE